MAAPPQQLNEPPTFFRHIVLPVGISFYTFQSLSYTIDVYRGRQRPTKRLLDFAVYVALFPKLVAGPIIRSSVFLPQLRHNHNATSEEIRSGIDQAVRGLVKKVLIADGLAAYVDIVCGSPGQFGAVNHLLAVYA